MSLEDMLDHLGGQKTIRERVHRIEQILVHLAQEEIIPHTGWIEEIRCEHADHDLAAGNTKLLGGVADDLEQEPE